MYYERHLQYVEDVSSGKEVCGKHIKQAVARHIKDLKTGHKRGIYFDEAAAKKYVEAARLFKHTSGEFAGKPFELVPFQAFMIASIFGWKNKDGTRRFRRVYLETAKKSGKSEIAALIGNLALILDGEYGAQVYSAATKRDQAMFVFRAASIMIKFLQQDSKYMRKFIVRQKNRIYIPDTESWMEALGSDYDSTDGVNSYVGLIDEYHAHKTSHLSDTIRNSGAARIQPLHVITTTAGFNLQGPCYRIERTEGERILNGTIQDDSFFVMIFTIDEDDDWQNPDIWVKANPNIGRTVKLKNMIDLFTAAKNGGTTREVDFKTKNLNIWVHSQYNWIPDELFMKAKMEYSLQDMKERGVMCWGGMDLGQTSDLTCVAFLFDPEKNNGRYIFHLFSWACEAAVEKATEQGLPYRDWERAKCLNVTPGQTTDYDYMEDVLREFRNNHEIVNIGFDTANSRQLAIHLERDGFVLEPFSQGIVNMNSPTRTLEELFLRGVAGHDGNDLMRFMFQNVEIIRDSSGNIKVTKKDPAKKVDGVVAMIMALGQYMEWQKINGSAFEERGFYVL